MAEIARRAEVAEATVYNYFGTKEDLVYDGMVAFEDALLTAVRDRPPDRSVLAAFREFLLTAPGVLSGVDPASRTGPPPRGRSNLLGLREGLAQPSLLLRGQIGREQ